MISVAWIGPRPAPRVRDALRRAGVEIRREAAIALVRADRVPAPPVGAAHWIWIARRPPAAAEAVAAALRGAHDSLALSDPGLPRALAVRVRELAGGPAAPAAHPAMVGRSAAIRAVLAQLARAARTSMPVLLTGETGTGKDVAARIIHAWSARSGKPFVPINCAAIPNELIEAELFGYVRGAFSGAVRQYDGNIAAAAGGSVFLDEIDDTPPTLQVKLLRVLEDRVVSRLGENVWRQVDFRLVAATNRDLRLLIAQGQFGQDLYERLAIVGIQLPPLRERVEDLPELAHHFIARFYDEEQGEVAARVDAIDPRALAALAAYPWPGNVRELRNAIFQALVQKRSGSTILLSDLPRRLLVREEATASPVIDPAALSRGIAAGTFDLARERAALERAAVAEALARGGSPAAAARLLGRVGRGRGRDAAATVRAMMRRLGLFQAAARRRP
jgi:transcriptional regulator with PAS, ATPase and Fis domain